MTCIFNIVIEALKVPNLQDEILLSSLNIRPFVIAQRHQKLASCAILLILIQEDRAVVQPVLLLHLAIFHQVEELIWLYLLFALLLIGQFLADQEEEVVDVDDVVDLDLAEGQLVLRWGGLRPSSFA